MQNPYALMAVLLVLWGSYAAVSKLALKEMAIWPFRCFSFGIAFVTLAVPYFLRGGMKRLRALAPRELLRLLVYSIPSFLYYYFYSTALALTGAVEASVLNYTFPIFILLLAWPVCGEKLTLRGCLAVLLGFGGTMIVLLADGSGKTNFMSPGALCALCGAVCWGLFSDLGRKAPGDPETANLVYMASGFVLSLAGMLISGESPAMGAGQALCLLWNGVFSLAGGDFVWFRVLKVAPAALAANLSFLTPFANLLFIALILREPIAWQHWAGLAVILLGVLVQSLPGRKRARETA